jgi:hypothetical protein
MFLYFVLRRGPIRDMLRPGMEDIHRLKAFLSARARSQLEEAQQAGHLEELAQRWMRAAMSSKKAAPSVEKEQLRDFYHKAIDAKQREYLESLPPERMRFELLRMYRTDQFRRLMESSPPGNRHPGGFRDRGPNSGRGTARERTPQGVLLRDGLPPGMKKPVIPGRGTPAHPVTPAD